MGHSPWVAIDASTDPRSRARELARARDHVMEGGPKPDLVRDAIKSSWERSADAGVDPDGTGPRIGLSTDEAAQRWLNHPLSIAEPILRELLRDVRSDDDQVVLICDADGTLLWIDGEPAVVDAAQEIHLQPGALWQESEAGTNAMGTALALGHPIQVFSAEHFSSGVHQWTCSAAPIRDPRSGRTLGVIDLSGELGTAHPHSLALIEAAARVIEAKLALVGTESQPAGELGLRLLGDNRALVRSGSSEHELSPRHSEIVALLALGTRLGDAEDLARELYGDEGKAVSARAELSRLRRTLGERLASGSPELVGEVRSDFAEAERLAADGRFREALELYRGPLLPKSRVPGIVELRERLDNALREGAMRSEDPALLGLWLETASGDDDLVACREYASRLGAADPRRPAALSRLRRLATA